MPKTKPTEYRAASVTPTMLKRSDVYYRRVARDRETGTQLESGSGLVALQLLHDVTSPNRLTSFKPQSARLVYCRENLSVSNNISATGCWPLEPRSDDIRTGNTVLKILQYIRTQISLHLSWILLTSLGVWLGNTCLRNLGTAKRLLRESSSLYPAGTCRRGNVVSTSWVSTGNLNIGSNCVILWVGWN